MNDPGLDGPIDEASQQVKENTVPEKIKSQDKEEEDEERNFVMPARWWYASTGFPLIAGTFGPMANAFSICALVENWRVEIPPGGTEEHGIDIKDPGWLIAVNAVSLVCALAANMSLLLNMARRVPFQVAQPVTIIGFWMASVLLIALIAVASHDFHAPGVRDQALTQAYYYATFAAGLYQIISYLMCVTVYGAYTGHYSREFKLTVAQRTLMLQTIAFLAYQLLGALVFSKIEGWKFLDAVYWADFTSLTIGIGGDYVPSTHLGRGLLFPFAMGGIIILGLVVGSIRTLILDRGKKKLAARLTEKTRERLVKEIERALKSKKRLRHSRIVGLERDKARALTIKPEDDAMPEIERREAEFVAMRKVQDRATTERKYYSLMASTFAFAFLWTIGALVFFKAEKNQQWSYFESLYFAYTSLLTIGYGDLQPISNSGKPFFVFWSLLAIPTLTILISDMGDTVVKFIKEATIWLGEVTVLPNDEDSIRDRLKYGLYKVTLGKVDSYQGSRRAEEGSDSDSTNSFQELHPGLARLFRGYSRRKSGSEKKVNTDRVAADFEESERQVEEEARERGDKIAEDEHHYRHLLLSHVRRFYADSVAATPIKYSYKEWAGFLRLLGEDETDTSTHRIAQVSPTSPGNPREGRQSQDRGPGIVKERDSEMTQPAFADGQQGRPKWSWIGPQSPLMGDKEEAEWLLEKFMVRLERSLRAASQGRPDEYRKTARVSPHEDAGGKKSIRGSSDNILEKDQQQQWKAGEDTQAQG